MGMLSRMAVVVKAKAENLLGQMENPSEQLDQAYEKQIAHLAKVKKGLTEMVTNKRRLELQASKIEGNISKLDAQARKALQMNREDLARIALERKQNSLSELQGLDQQISGLEIQQEKLVESENRLKAKVASFKTKKEVMKAQHSAAEAQVRIGSALSGLSEEMGDIQLAVERVENKTESMRAKAEAIDELASIGVLDDPTSSNDDLDAQLDNISASATVEDELLAMKGEMSGEQKALGRGQGQSLVVRISNEGQYDLPRTYLSELNDIDNRIVDLVRLGNRREFEEMLSKMLDVVREHGTRLSDDHLVESELALPDADTSFEEAQQLFTGEGLIDG